MIIFFLYSEDIYEQSSMNSINISRQGKVYFSVSISITGNLFLLSNEARNENISMIKVEIVAEDE